jgi:three-Cys-motif partner protein
MLEIKVIDDGLPIPDVGAWTEDKHRLVGYYAGMFATAMKRKWECRVYIDLFAGSGYSSLKGTGRLIPGSPFYALEISDKFDRYIFCDSDKETLGALESRIQQRYKNVDISYLNVDVNACTSKIIEKIPMHSKDFKVLSFCLVDPYKLDDISFSTMRCLSQRYIDFLVLIPTYMDVNRNVSNYVKPGNKVIAKFLDDDGWRVEWQQVHSRGLSFPKFVLEQFSKKMKVLEYSHGGYENAELVRRSENNIPLYHLAFFSRHPLGGKFWNQAKKGVDPQLHLFEQ